MKQYKVVRISSSAKGAKVVATAYRKNIAETELVQKVTWDVHFLRECGVAAEVKYNSEKNIVVSHCNGQLHYSIEEEIV